MRRVIADACEHPPRDVELVVRRVLRVGRDHGREVHSVVAAQDRELDLLADAVGLGDPGGAYGRGIQRRVPMTLVGPGRSGWRYPGQRDDRLPGELAGRRRKCDRATLRGQRDGDQAVR